MGNKAESLQRTLSDSERLTSKDNFSISRALQLALDLASLVQMNTVSKKNLMLDFLIQNYRSAENHAKILKTDMRDDEIEALRTINAYIDIIPNQDTAAKLVSYKKMITAIDKVFQIQVRQ